MNRKLIRPKFSHYKDDKKQSPSKKKSHPSYDTHAENYYYLKQMNKKTLIGIVLVDGEKVEGQIEWYDYNCLITMFGNAFSYCEGFSFHF